MASNRFVIVAIFAVIVLSTIAMATEYIVGDENGWTNDGSVDYEAWAKGKMFNVGDLLGTYIYIHFN